MSDALPIGSGREGVESVSALPPPPASRRSTITSPQGTDKVVTTIAAASSCAQSGAGAVTAAVQTPLSTQPSSQAAAVSAHHDVQPVWGEWFMQGVLRIIAAVKAHLFPEPQLHEIFRKIVLDAARKNNNVGGFLCDVAAATLDHENQKVKEMPIRVDEMIASINEQIRRERGMQELEDQGVAGALVLVEDRGMKNLQAVVKGLSQLRPSQDDPLTPGESHEVDILVDIGVLRIYNQFIEGIKSIKDSTPTEFSEDFERQPEMYSIAGTALTNNSVDKFNEKFIKFLQSHNKLSDVNEELLHKLRAQIQCFAHQEVVGGAMIVCSAASYMSKGLCSSNKGFKCSFSLENDTLKVVIEAPLTVQKLPDKEVKPPTVGHDAVRATVSINLTTLDPSRLLTDQPNCMATIYERAGFKEKAEDVEFAS